MNLSGEHRFAAPRERVYNLLLDPQALGSCMPGCRKLEPIDADHFALSFAVPVPSVKGEYEGTVEIVERDPPEAIRMKIAMSGQSGFVNADAHMQLQSVDGGTLVHYDADAQVGGSVALVGQRVLTGITRRQLDQMMRSLEEYRAGVSRPPWWQRLLAKVRPRRSRR